MSNVRLRPALLVFSLVALFAWTVFKGIVPLFHTDELYFWLATYQHGFIRRGLFGSIARLFIGTRDGAQVRLFAAESCLSALLALLVLAATLVWRVGTRIRGPLPWVMSGLLATSPLIGLVAHHVGYPDGIIAVIVLACGVSVAQAPAWAVCIVLLLGSMLHELVLLLLLPIVVFDRLINPRSGFRDTILIGAAAVIGLLLPLLGNASQSALISDLISAGVSFDVANEQVNTAMHQGIGKAAEKMLHTWESHPVNGCVGIIYAGLPGLMLMLLGWNGMLRLATYSQLWKRRLQVSLYVIACLGPIALLAVAWDLARLVSFTTLTSFTASYSILRRADVTASRATLIASFSLILAFFVLPVFNIYFDYARPLRLSAITKIFPPSAKVAVSAANFFNRDLSVAERVKLVSDPLYGNAR